MSWSDWKAFLESQITLVPEESGVYRLENVNDTLYIGRTDNLRRRLLEHLNSNDSCIKQATVFKYLVTTSPEMTEDALLKDYMRTHVGELPRCNAKRD